jgi:hypothetical protein
MVIQQQEIRMVMRTAAIHRGLWLTDVSMSKVQMEGLVQGLSYL